MPLIFSLKRTLFKSLSHTEIKSTASWMTSLTLTLPKTICTLLHVSLHFNKPFHKATASPENLSAPYLFCPILKVLQNQPHPKLCLTSLLHVPSTHCVPHQLQTMSVRIDTGLDNLHFIHSCTTLLMNTTCIDQGSLMSYDHFASPLTLTRTAAVASL